MPIYDIPCSGTCDPHEILGTVELPDGVPFDATTLPTARCESCAGLPLPPPPNYPDVFIREIYPTHGPVGTVVTVTGTNFSNPPDGVHFLPEGKHSADDYIACDFTFVDEASMTVTVPVGFIKGYVIIVCKGRGSISPQRFSVTE